MIAMDVEVAKAIRALPKRHIMPKGGFYCVR